MCDDHAGSHHESPSPGMSRRTFLGASGAVAVGAVAPALALTPAEAAPGVDGTKPFPMAMHVHSSFSEGWASMSQHLDQATKNGVKVLWFTDHDFRMSGLNFKQVVHFTSLTQETGQGGRWEWTRRTVGSLTADSAGQVVQSPASPNDTVPGGSLSLNARSNSTALATLGFFADAHPAGWNYQTNLYGQVFTIDVMPTSIGPNAYLEFLVGGSYHPATSGRPAGRYSVSYRFGGGQPPGTRITQGLLGIVYLAAPTNQWTTVSVNPCDDIAALWPDIDEHDFSSNELTLSASSTGAQASGYFDYLKFSRPNTSGNIPLRIQRGMRERYATKYPKVVQQPALEMGQFLPHLNWFGGSLTLADYSSVTTGNHLDFMKQQVQTAHAAGGVVSYNHPYGYTSIGLLPQATQDANRAQLASTLLGNKAIGCDLIEVGYRSRAGMDLAHHVSLWDVLSRNALFLTGNGVTDDHSGTNWLTLTNNWVTSVWAPKRSRPALLHALRSGRAWLSSLSGFKGQLDLLVDNAVPMGSASVSGVAQRNVLIVATGMPAGSTLRVVRGTVDYAGTGDPTPSTQVVATFTAAQLSGGSATMSINTSTSRFVRTEVVNNAGVVVAVSNPVWLLREQPPGGIPAPRQA